MEPAKENGKEAGKAPGNGAAPAQGAVPGNGDAPAAAAAHAGGGAPGAAAAHADGGAPAAEAGSGSGDAGAEIRRKGSVVRFTPIEDKPIGQPVISMQDIESVGVLLSIIVGRARKTVRDLIALKEGSVVRLDRNVGVPLDLLVHDRLVARGDIVVAEGGRLGIRIRELIEPAEEPEKA